MHVNGNSTTALMHLLVWTELQRMRVNQIIPITRMRAEQTVILGGPHDSRPREGRYDFWVETPRKTIGFEVLTRPSKGKMVKKIAYRNEVDDFVFAIPHDALRPYQRTEKNHGWKVRPKFLPAFFAQKGLYAWLVDLEDRRIVAKAPFPRLYNVEGEIAAKTRRRR